LAKILALAERGVGGEKDNAQRILDNLLKKHGLSLDEVIRNKGESELDWKAYSFGNITERTILFQVYISIMNTVGLGYKKWSKKSVSLEADKLTHVEITEKYRYFRKLWKDELSVVVEAFVHKHNLFSDIPAKEVLLDEERAKKVMKMVLGMGESNYISTKRRIGGRVEIE
jgi:hypothetical protein